MNVLAPRRMLDETPSLTGWRVGLLREHLEEAASLWEQRPADRDNPELSWEDLGSEEFRLEAHLDALVLGGDLALAVCRQQALEGDPGELHAALRVFCRYRRGDLVGACLESIDPDNAEALDAMSDALAAEMPTEWQAGALRPDLLADPRRLRLAADLAASRRLASRDTLQHAMGEAPPAVQASVLRALGRSSNGIDSAALIPLISSADHSVRFEAGLALLRSGMLQNVHAVLAAVRTDPALVPLLALAGRETAVPWLLEVLAHPAGAHNAAIALGLMGDLAAIPALIAALDGEAGSAAGMALYVMTGTLLLDETFVEDEPEEDELFDDERGAAKPDSPQDEPRGTTIEEVSKNPARWSAWFDQNRSALGGAERYRLGQPAGPESCVGSLAAPTIPYAWRSLIAEELVVRYRMPVPFETTWSVVHQHAALARMRDWARTDSSVPGRWYVGGHYAGGSS